jgi:pimeloyl-ACP methyl ester carboxylesterase
MIEGGGGTRLHVVETGNPKGRPILFLHGFSQCHLTWRRQLSSSLADDFRLLAMDLRGHGLSEKPRDGYSDSRLWAEDIHATIEALNLDHPILCGWSYGPLVILDYIRHYGEDEIGGANFIGGVTKLGSDEAASVLSAEFLGLMPGFFSTDAEASLGALDSLLRLCFASELTTIDRYLMLGYGASVPSYVRQALLSRSLDNDDLLPKIQTPVLITHGAEDAVVRTTVIERQMTRIGPAKVRMMENAGHACFWDNAASYERSLRDFVAAL